MSQNIFSMNAHDWCHIVLYCLYLNKSELYHQSRYRIIDREAKNTVSRYIWGKGGVMIPRLLRCNSQLEGNHLSYSFVASWKDGSIIRKKREEPKRERERKKERWRCWAKVLVILPKERRRSSIGGKEGEREEIGLRVCGVSSFLSNASRSD